MWDRLWDWNIRHEDKAPWVFAGILIGGTLARHGWWFW